MANSPFIFKGLQAKMLNAGGIEFKDSTTIEVYEGSPDGDIERPKGSLFLDKTNGLLYQNRGATIWNQVNMQLEKERVNLTAADSPVTLTALNSAIYAVNLTDGDVVINLPAVTADNDGDNGFIYIELNPNNANVLTINTSGTDTIRGQTSVSMNVLRDGFQLFAHDYGHPHYDALVWERTDEIVYQPGNAGVTSIATLQQLLSYSFSSGQISGCVLTDNGDGTIAVTAGEWKLRAGDDVTEDCRVYKVEGVASIEPLEGTSYLVIDVNSGSPSWQIVSDITTVACLSSCVQAVLYKDGTGIKWIYLGDYIVDFMGRFAKSKAVTDWLAYGSGIMISNPATLRLAVTAGVLYQGTISLTVPSFDTNGADRITSYYRNGSGGWNKLTGQTDLDNQRYDNGSGALVDVENGRYTNFWIYVLVDNPSELVAVYPQARFTSLAGALAEAVPAVLPPFASKYSIGRLIGRVTLRETVPTAFQNISSVFTQAFTSGTPINHNDLAGRDDAGNHAKIIPPVDSAQGVQITTASGLIPILNVDTVSQRIGINISNPLFNFHTVALSNNDASFGLICDSTHNTAKSFMKIGQTNSFMRIDYYGAVYTSSGIRQANGALIESIGTAGLNICARPVTTSEGIKFFTGGDTTANERMRIITNGNIGIGTPTPEQLLHIRGANPTMRLDDSTNEHKFQITNSNSALVFYDANVDSTAPATTAGHLFRCNSGTKNLLALMGTGNVGIGLTSNITSKLTVSGLGAIVEARLSTAGSPGYFVSDNTVETGGKKYRFGYTGANTDKGSFNIYNETDDISSFSISSGGNVSIGSSNPAVLANYVTLTLGDNNAAKSGLIKFRSTYSSGDGAELFQLTNGDFACNINGSTRAFTFGVGWGVLVGFTKLGSDAPAIKHKKLTGTTNAAEGGFVEINHGIPEGKILDVAVRVWYSATGSMPPEFTGISGYQYHTYHDGIRVYVTNHATNSENILSKDIKILITYEE